MPPAAPAAPVHVLEPEPDTEENGGEGQYQGVINKKILKGSI